MADCTFYWHDYETFGADPRRDRPAQFAGIRTDLQLNEIGAPEMVYCRPSDDYVPDAMSCLITGITPQEALTRGVSEHDFSNRIHAELAAPGTIGAGYNSIRFDDEVTRHLFWRTLQEPYAREWQNDCGRWDLLDVMRLAHALRPDGIEWPQNAEQGVTSFRLEHLTAANGIAHVGAHDALVDVRATIAMARRLRQAQPKLFDFALALRSKHRVAQELGLPAAQEQAKPFLHVSNKFGADRGCLAVMWPLATHPTNKNELLAWDLSRDPAELADLDAEAIRARLFVKQADLPEGVQRLPVKGVHLNKSPMVVGNLKTLTDAQAARWGVDMATVMRHAEAARALPDLSAIWAAVYARHEADARPDVESDLYGGFVNDADRRRLAQLRAAPAEALGKVRSSFDDPRLEELAFRWRARNFPETLNGPDQARWQAHRAARLIEGASGARTVEQLFAQIDELSESRADDERAEGILGALYDWGAEIAPEDRATTLAR